MCFHNWESKKSSLRVSYRARTYNTCMILTGTHSKVILFRSYHAGRIKTKNSDEKIGRGNNIRAKAPLPSRSMSNHCCCHTLPSSSMHILSCCSALRRCHCYSSQRVQSSTKHASLSHTVAFVLSAACTQWQKDCSYMTTSLKLGAAKAAGLSF